MKQKDLNESKRIYWSKRSNMMYYKYLEILVRVLAKEAKSLIDVGSSDAQYIEDFDWIPTRNTLDIDKPYESQNIKGFQMNFFDFHPEKKYDFATCMQVLEHIPDAGSFAKKLFEVADRVLISVPYLWEENSSEGHIHDPVDLEKLREWTGREPSYYIIVKEPLDNTPKSNRLICYYHPEDEEFDIIDAKRKIRTVSMNASSSVEDMYNKFSSVEQQIKKIRKLIKEDRVNNDKLYEQVKSFMDEQRLRDTLWEKEKELIFTAEKNNKLEDELIKRKKEIDQLNNQYRKSVKDSNRIEREYKKVIKSRSWRYTYPIRKFMDIVKRR